MTQGFSSEAARKAYTVKAVTWTVVVFVLQLILPIVIMAIVIAFSIFSMLRSMEIYLVGQAAPYRDGIVAVSQSLDFFEPGGSTLVAMNPAGIAPLYALPDSDVSIEYNGDDIWCFTKPVLYHYDGQAWEVITNTVAWDSIVDVRAIDGGIIVWTQTTDEENRYWSYFEDCWIMLPERLSAWKAYERYVEWRGNMYHLAWEDGMIYSRCNSTGDVREVAEVPFARAEEWEACALSNGVYVIATHLGGAAPLVARSTGGPWEVRTVPGMPWAGFESAILPGSTTVDIIGTVMPNAVSWYRFDGDRVKRVSRHGNPFFSRWMLVCAVMAQAGMGVLPLALAGILTGLMRRYRTAEYIVETGDVRYATLLRRGLAALIDYAILFGVPYGIMIAAGFWFDYEMIMSNLMLIPIIIVSFVALFGLGIAGLVLWSFLEGRYGQTPGKRILGIRVVRAETLGPCGFWRGLGRNLLRLVDGMFNYMIGLTIAGFTEHRQRLGDMLAGTVVIRDEKTTKM